VLAACGRGDGEGTNDANVEGSKDSGVAGTYVMDEEAVRAAAKEWIMQNPVPPGMSAEQFEKMLEDRIDADIARRSIALTLKPDGTFVFAVKIGEESMDSGGTWTHEGSRLTLLTTRESGKEKSPPSEFTAEIADGRITMSEKMEYPLVLQKR
jgi:hypothetical protein